LVSTLKKIKGILDLDCEIFFSSQLLQSKEKGQKGVLNLVKAVGGEKYVNPPGGRNLYDPLFFSKNGVSLNFLSPWQGSTQSVIAHCFEANELKDLKSQIISQSGLIK